jgi:hypothetical protein
VGSKNPEMPKPSGGAVARCINPGKMPTKNHRIQGTKGTKNGTKSLPSSFGLWIETESRLTLLTLKYKSEDQNTREE